MKRNSATYREAGVDISSAGRFIHAIQPLARMTRRPGLLKGIGGFGGLFQLGALGRPGTVLVASADGVGTKLKLAQRVGIFSPLGVDLVAMNVNDILCTGAEPLFFLDYIATSRLDARLLLEVVRGVVRGCVESNCVLLGGETAQMPLVYRPGDFDLAGFAVGAIAEKKVISAPSVRAGDVLLGLSSNGVHANGFTLVQKVLSVPQQKRLARELMRPTRIYVRPVLALLKSGIPVHGIAHITGGSFREKLVRAIPAGLSARIRKGSWTVPPLFKKIQSAGVAEPEMYHTFNMGIGMVLVLPRAAAGKAQKLLKRHGQPSRVIGEVRPGTREVVIS